MSSAHARIDPALLPTLLAVVEAGRISAAAKWLHLSQPAVTAQIRKLEEAVGAPLFVRSVRGVVPTPAGERLAGYARTLRRLLDEATAAVAQNDDALGDLVLSASTTIAGHVIPELLARFRRATRRDVVLEVGNTEEVSGGSRAGTSCWGWSRGTRGRPASA